MLRGARLLLRSAVTAFSRLAHALISLALVMSLCSPTSSSPTVIPTAPWQQQQQQQQARPATTTGRKKQQQLAVVEDDRDHHHHHHLPAPAPAFVGNNEEEQENKKKKAATRGGRPPRLVIPPPVMARAAGVDPFGVAADWEADVAATEVEVQGEGFCLASRRGVRHAMEDGYGVVTDADNIRGSGSQMAFYGVYDGHGGRAAVDFVADKLGKNVVAAAAASSRRRQEEEEEKEGGQQEDEVTAAIRSAYLTTDSEFLSQGVRGGACAVTALVKDGELYVANVGDCRAVLGGSDGAATALTSDHTASGREDERRRIESSGGYVSCGGSGVWRVQGSLAVTRALGDAAVKPWVSGEPEVSRRRITPGCRFLVLATDGLWNKVSCQEAVDAVFVAAGAATTVGAAAVGVGVGPASCCKDLVALARSRGSRDDITVMVVDLQRFVPSIVVR